MTVTALRSFGSVARLAEVKVTVTVAQLPTWGHTRQQEN
jgi:hypothetical protein